VSIRDEVRASTAAHRDLGPGYDTAVAEGLVERIGEEIDKRVDARLYGQAPYQNPPPRPRLRREPVPGRIGFGAVVLGREWAICDSSVKANCCCVEPRSVDG
jgi:hypothetical protein